MKTDVAKVKVVNPQTHKVEKTIELDVEVCESNKEAEEVSQKYYKCPAYEKFNTIHRIRQQDKVRQIELLKFEDPAKGAAKKLQAHFKTLSEDERAAAIQKVNEILNI